MQRSVKDKYLKLLKENPNKFLKDYKETIKAVENSTAKYKNKPVPFLYTPKFFNDKDIENFKNLTSTLMDIINKVIDKYIDSKEYRKKFGYSKLLEELILIDHGYSANIPMARFDIFYDGDDFKFCELNADGSSAMNEDNTLNEIFLNTKPIDKLKDKYEFYYLELIDKWVDESIKIYKEFDKTKHKPNIAIVDFEGLGTVEEFKVFKKAFERKGYNTYIVDPRELKYIDGKLYYNDKVISLIYRRAVTRKLMEESENIKDFLNAYRDKAVCVIGPLRSQIIHNKIFFEILHDEETLSFLTEAERNFIKNHIPYTKEFSNENIYKKALNNKDKYVLKPKDLYASKGVFVGRDFSLDKWIEKLESCINNDYLLQEFITPYKSEVVEFINDELVISEVNNITGLFMYNEKFQGVYSRVGKNNIISGLHGGYTLPSLFTR